MSNILIDLGFLKIYWYSFLIFLALLLGGFLALKEGKKHSIKEDLMIDMFFFLIPIFLIGARIYYVIFNLDYYKSNIIEIFEVWKGGLAIHGGMIFALLYIIFYTKKHNISLFRMLDIMCVSLIIGQAIGRWGNFFNKEAHGDVVSLEFLQKIIPFDFVINGMNIGGLYYHPTFLYESVWCLIGFVILLIIRRLKNIKVGQLIGFYLIWYGIGRFMIESLRTDSLMLSSFKVAQIVSIIMLVSGIIIIILKNGGSKYEGNYNSN